MKLKLSLFLTCLLTISGNALGQKTEAKTGAVKPVEEKAAAPAKLPTVKEILDKYAEAIGGRAAHEKIKTRISKGTYEMAPMGVKGTFDSFQAAGKSYTSINLQGIGEIVVSYDDKASWTTNPLQGMRDLEGDELIQTKLVSNIYRDVNIERLYTKLEVKGTEKIGGQDAFVVVGTPAGLAPETFYFDAKSGLLLRWDSILVSPEGKFPTKTFFEDYRAVGSLKLPFKTRAVTPIAEIITTVSEVKHDEPVEDAKFAKPKK